MTLFAWQLHYCLAETFYDPKVEKYGSYRITQTHFSDGRQHLKLKKKKNHKKCETLVRDQQIFFKIPLDLRVQNSALGFRIQPTMNMQ